MRRALGICIALIVAVGSAYAQDAQKVLDTFRRNFAIASLDVKIQILQDAATGQDRLLHGPALSAGGGFRDRQRQPRAHGRALQPACRHRRRTGRNVGFTAARFSVWKLFQITPDTQTLSKAATALGTLGAGDAEIIADLNHWLDAQNSVFATGQDAGSRRARGGDPVPGEARATPPRSRSSSPRRTWATPTRSARLPRPPFSLSRATSPPCSSG